MDVDQSSGESVDEYGSQDTHECSEYDQIRRIRFKGLRQGGIEGLTIRVVAMRKHEGGDARSPGTFEPRCLGLIAANNHHLAATIPRQ
jgi:hypothetical protein